MANELAVPTALDRLDELIISDASPQDLLQILRTLQFLGISKADLRVHIERIRARNEARGNDPGIEDTAILALDVVEGDLPSLGLKWDASEIASVYLGLWLTERAIVENISFALSSIDLLPPRPHLKLNPPSSRILATTLVSGVRETNIRPQRADFYRVPKAGYVTRPVALLAPMDRVVYEALAGEIAHQLDDIMPSVVAWPRSREKPEDAYSVYSIAPKGWAQSHIIVADIESYYESLSHPLLTLFLGANFSLSRSYLHALEGMLDAIMGSSFGIPQGPPGSEMFATAFLIPVDRNLEERGWNFARYADDYMIGANSVTEARRKIEQFESLLREVGLRLSPQKTKIMRIETYLRGLTGPSRHVESFRQHLQLLAEEELRESEPDHLEETLREIGASEETLWDLFYHQTTNIEEVIRDLRDSLTPGLVQTYAAYFVHVARTLRDSPPDDTSVIERDLRECLLFMAGAQEAVPTIAVDTVLKWFPRLARYIAHYLASLGDRYADDVRTLVTSWLEGDNDTDWVSAWVCHVLERRPGLVDRDVGTLLAKAITDSSAGNLTRAVAVRVLATAHQLDSNTWARALEISSAPAASELIFAAVGNVQLYPWGIQHPQIEESS